MRVHLSLASHEGGVVREASFDSPVVSVGAADHNMFAHWSLPRFDVVNDGYFAEMRWQGRAGVERERLRRKNVVPIGDRLTLRILLYPRPDAVPRERGICPACGDKLVESLGGGAYRSIARTERRCPTCASVVLDLRDAPDVLAQFAARSNNDWVHVQVSSRCPKCLDSMTRAVYVSGRTEVEVERCTRCGLVVLEPEDERRLKGRRP